MALTKIPSELSSTTGIVDNSNATAITIDSNENVGIGTTTLSYKFQISDGTRTAIINPNSSLDGIFFGTKESKPLIIGTADNERMRIDSSGNVGIGLNPSARLSIRPSGSGSEDSHFGFGANRDTYISTSSTGTIIFRNASERMRIDASGRLLMGKTSATATGFGTELRGSQIIIGKTSSGTVNGIYFNHNSSYVGGLNYTNTATALATSSDQRLKENIADADDAGSKIDAIQVRKFDWKEDNSHQEYGFIAQELEQVFPYAVHTAQNEMQTKGVDYASLVPMMLKEIQSLRNRVAQLEE